MDEKITSFARIFSPFYVLVTGSLGIFIALVLFTWNYPIAGDEIGQRFVAASPFYIWVFLFAVLCCMLTIFFIPGWGLLFWLMKNRIHTEDGGQKARFILLLLIEGIFLTIAVFAILAFTRSSRIGLPLDDYVPIGHTDRMNFMYIVTFLTALPALLGMLVIHAAAGEVAQKIEVRSQDRMKLFELKDDLLFYRMLLQNYLIILGIILSMIPITTAGLRAIMIALDPVNADVLPVTYVLLFGLIFTILLLLIYIPAHLALAETSRKLRDRLCPLDTFDTLKQDIDQRKTLDELLQTNIGITQNLKSGLITLFPLVSSLITSLLDIKLSF